MASFRNEIECVYSFDTKKSKWRHLTRDDEIQGRNTVQKTICCSRIIYVTKKTTCLRGATFALNMQYLSFTYN